MDQCARQPIVARSRGKSRSRAPSRAPTKFDGVRSTDPRRPPPDKFVCRDKECDGDTFRVYRTATVSNALELQCVKCGTTRWATNMIIAWVVFILLVASAVDITYPKYLF